MTTRGAPRAPVFVREEEVADFTQVIALDGPRPVEAAIAPDAHEGFCESRVEDDALFFEPCVREKEWQRLHELRIAVHERPRAVVPEQGTRSEMKA